MFRRGRRHPRRHVPHDRPRHHLLQARHASRPDHPGGPDTARFQLDKGQPAQPREHSHHRGMARREPRRHADGTVRVAQGPLLRPLAAPLRRTRRRRRRNPGHDDHRGRPGRRARPGLDQVEGTRPGTLTARRAPERPGLVPLPRAGSTPTPLGPCGPRGCSSPVPPGAQSSNRC